MKLIQGYNDLKKKHPTIIENLEALFFGIIITVVIIQFIIPARVDGDSMNNTLIDKDWLIVEKLSYKLRGPSRGDIIAIDPSDYPSRLVKRIIAIGNDEIEITTSCDVIVNGQILNETYLKETMRSCSELKMIIPPGEVFVMGDNRNNSKDSRSSQIGTINFKDEVIGRILFRVYPFSKMRIF